MNQKKNLIVITGPTASGKSALAVSLAKILDTEIISADSRQIYKGIPIATAVPSIKEKEGVKHHLLEILDLDAYYSASKFDEDASKIIKNIFQQRDYAIVCGGSMLYLDALLKGIDELPTVPQDIREKLMIEWSEKGNVWLLNELSHLDPAYFNKVDHRNLKRVFHAVEISMTAGVPYSSLLSEHRQKKDIPYNLIKVCLIGERNLLFERINKRVLDMMASGLEEEARKVYPLKQLNSLNTVGLKEMFAWFDGIMTKDEAVARIQKNTRVYAKKQLTWHKRDEYLKFLDFSLSRKDLIDRILSFLHE